MNKGRGTRANPTGCRVGPTRQPLGSGRAALDAAGADTTAHIITVPLFQYNIIVLGHRSCHQEVKVSTPGLRLFHFHLISLGKLFIQTPVPLLPNGIICYQSNNDAVNCC